MIRSCNDEVGRTSSTADEWSDVEYMTCCEPTHLAAFQELENLGRGAVSEFPNEGVNALVFPKSVH